MRRAGISIPFIVSGLPQFTESQIEMIYYETMLMVNAFIAISGDYEYDKLNWLQPGAEGFSRLEEVGA